MILDIKKNIYLVLTDLVFGSSRMKSKCWRMDRRKGSEGVSDTEWRSTSKHSAESSKSGRVLSKRWTNSSKSSSLCSWNTLSWNFRSVFSLRPSFCNGIDGLHIRKQGSTDSIKLDGLPRGCPLDHRA